MLLYSKYKVIFTLICFLFLSFAYSDKTMFENFNAKGKEQWEFITDNVMGGVSFGKIDFLSEQGEDFIRMTGFVSLENNGGFIQVRRKIRDSENDIIKGIKLISRGNDRNYYIHLRTKFTLLPWQYYQGVFTVKEEWQESIIEIKDFKRSGSFLPKLINPKNIKSIAIVAFGKEHQARVDVKEILFY